MKKAVKVAKFRCTRCRRMRPWSEGAHDDRPNWCDRCWHERWKKLEVARLRTLKKHLQKQLDALNRETEALVLEVKNLIEKVKENLDEWPSGRGKKEEARQ